MLLQVLGSSFPFSYGIILKSKKFTSIWWDDGIAVLKSFVANDANLHGFDGHGVIECKRTNGLISMSSVAERCGLLGGCRCATLPRLQDCKPILELGTSTSIVDIRWKILLRGSGVVTRVEENLNWHVPFTRFSIPRSNAERCRHQSNTKAMPARTPIHIEYRNQIHIDHVLPPTVCFTHQQTQSIDDPNHSTHRHWRIWFHKVGVGNGFLTGGPSDW